MYEKILTKFTSVQRFIQAYLPKYAYLRDDVIIMSYPKSGRNWVSFLLANAMVLKDGKNIDIHFNNYSEWVSDEIPKKPRANSFSCPRIVSTHKRFVGQSGKIIYILRHPADVMESYFVYLKEYEEFDEIGSFSEFLRSEKWYGVHSWYEHVKSIENKDDFLLVKFEDMKKDSEQVLGKMCEYIGIDVSTKNIQESAQRSTFEAMKRMERKYGINGGKSKKRRFMRSGKVSKGKEFFNHEDYKYLLRISSDVMGKYGYDIPDDKQLSVK